jgi:hypothetical protein
MRWKRGQNSRFRPHNGPTYNGLKPVERPLTPGGGLREIKLWQFEAVAAVDGSSHFLL